MGITPQWGGAIFASAFPPFHAVYPGVTIELMEETAHPLECALIDGKLDMAILPLSPGDTFCNESVMLTSEELVLAIPTVWAGSFQQSSNLLLPAISLSGLQNRPFILSKTDTTIRRIENECFHSCKFLPTVLTEINNHTASLSLVEQGIGVTFIPASYIRHSPKVVYASCIPRAQWYITVAYRHNFKPQKIENYFLHLVQQFFDRDKINSRD